MHWGGGEKRVGAKCRRIVRKEQGRPPSELPPPNKEKTEKE